MTNSLRMFRSRFSCWLCLATAAAVAAAVAVPSAGRADQPSADAMAHATALSRAFREAAEATTPTVVVVRSEVKARQPQGRQPQGRGPRGRGDNPFKGTPFENMFPDGLPEGFEFNMPEGGSMPRRSGVGSGVIVDPSGIVLTNNHVVEGADEVVVELTDGREFKAKEIKTDPESDLAVIRLADAKDLPTAKLGDSDKLSIGDWVIAIGTPFELETTVSAGIISGKGRELGGIRRAQFLQTDAAINPGNSGGALVDAAGTLVGINTAIYSQGGGSLGIGFAVPVELAREVMESIVREGRVVRGWIGVEQRELTPDLAASLGLQGVRGVLITGVLADGPAGSAGMRPGDVVSQVGDRPVATPEELLKAVASLRPQSPVILTVQRGGKAQTLNVTVGQRPAPASSPGRPSPR